MVAWILKTTLTVVIALSGLALARFFFGDYVYAMAYHLNLSVFFFLGWLVEPETARFLVLSLFLGAVFLALKKISGIFNA